ncbi:MAG: amidohydrolase family protein [Pseudomonadota bacterium]
MIIDAHHHFWSLDAQWCHWPTPDLAGIYQDFGPDSLSPILRNSGVDRTVLVQAAPDIRETNALLAIADNTPFVGGVVGWVPLEKPLEAAEQLEGFSLNSQFKGVRAMLQDMDAREWILNEALEPALNILVARSFTFDALILPDQLPYIANLAKRLPNLKIVIDHGAKPNIAERSYDQWKEDISAFRYFDNVFCKLSGLMTEAKNNDGADALRPISNHLINCFGADRLMWGSDWPVLNLASSYEDWLAICRRLTNHLSSSAKDAIFGGTAAAFYHLSWSKK